MSIGTPPPVLPPQVSPDGKWIWDGHQWQPLPEMTWEPDAAAVIPQAVAAVPIPVRVQAAPVEVRPQPAAFSYPVDETPVTPLWVEPARSGLTIYMYAGAAAVVLVMLMMILNSTNIIRLPWPGGASSSTGPTIRAASTPKTSDYARADRFVNVYLAPALPSISHTLPALQTACTGTFSSGCLTALNAAKQQMNTVLSTIANGDVPTCIASGSSMARFDLESMADDIDMSLNGYQDNNGAQVYQGIYRFAYYGRSLKGDVAAINAQKAHCSKVTPT